MAFSDVSRPLANVDAAERVTYLKRVLLLSAGGLFGSGSVGVLTAAAIYILGSIAPQIVFNQFVQLGVILGSFGIAQYLAPRLVFSGTNSKYLGYGLAVVFQGIAMGYLLLTAIPIGGLRMIDGEEADDKILAVLKDDAVYGRLHDVSQMPDALVDRLRHYFLTYKQAPDRAARGEPGIGEAGDAP